MKHILPLLLILAGAIGALGSEALPSKAAGPGIESGSGRDTAFFGAHSIDANFNILTPTAEKAVMKRTICEHANSRYLVVDRSKFYRQALMRVNSLSAYDGVITDKDFTAEEKEKLDQLGINIIPVSKRM